MKNYGNAFSEVYEILNCLEDDEFNKIPIDLINVITENRNLEYNYEIHDDIELKDHKMLPETKAILFNIFRDYLSTPIQKEKIIRMQAEERRKNEELKRKQYYASRRSI